MIPPDAGREPRTDSPKFRAVATGDLISQKSQQEGKEKVALHSASLSVGFPNSIPFLPK